MLVFYIVALQVIAPILFDEHRVSNIVSSITYDGENTWWKQTFCGKHIVFDPGNDGVSPGNRIT